MLWTFVFALLGLFVLFICKLYYNFLQTKNEFPCFNPNVGFFLGDLISVAKAIRANEAIDRYQEQVERVGPIFQNFGIVGRRRLFLQDPALIEHMLLENDWPKKGFQYNTIQKWLGQNLLSEPDYDTWKAQRRTLVQAFSTMSLKAQVPFMHDELATIISKFDKVANTGQYIDIDDWFMRFTLDFVGQSAFGEKFNAQTEQGDEMLQMFVHNAEEVLRSLMLPFRLRLPWLFPSAALLLKNTEKLKSMVRKMIAKQRSQPPVELKDDENQRVNLLQLMMSLKDPETGHAIHDEVIVSNVLLFMFAGTDTSAHTLSFAILELCRNPDVFIKARKEVDETFQGKRRFAEWADIAKLEYLGMVIKETLRKHASGLGTERQIQEDLKIDNFVLKKGYSVTVPNFLVHYNSKYYPAPHRFIPERWTKEEVQKRPKGTYFPFSLGPRDCIGKLLATTEITIVLATLISRYNFSLDSDQKVKKKMTLVISPVNLRVAVSHREHE